MKGNEEMGSLALTGGEPVRTAPYPAWPIWDGREIEALTAVITSDQWGGFPEPGPQAAECAASFAALQGAKHGICMANGSVTMSVALRAAGIQLGDEVIVPAYTFVATAIAALDVGAIPVLVDIDPNNFCIDPQAIEATITPRTRAIILVHLGSLMADMDAIMALAQRHDLIVVEDCAHAHGARWRDRGAGSIGHFGSFSMQSSKLMTCGEGGILLTNDDSYAERCHSLIDCGRAKDPERARYRIGTNLRLSELQAAVLNVQLSRLADQSTLRRERASYLESRLPTVPGVRLLRQDARQTYRAVYKYIIAIDPDAFGGATSARVCEALRAEGIVATWENEALHRHPLFQVTPENHFVAKLFPEQTRFRHRTFPVAERAARWEAVWLHQQMFLGDQQGIEDVIVALQKIQRHAEELH